MCRQRQNKVFTFNKREIHFTLATGSEDVFNSYLDKIELTVYYKINNEESFLEVAEIESKGGMKIEDIAHLVKGERGRTVMDDGDLDNGIWSGGMIWSGGLAEAEMAAVRSARWPRAPPRPRRWPGCH